MSNEMDAFEKALDRALYEAFHVLGPNATPEQLREAAAKVLDRVARPPTVKDLQVLPDGGFHFTLRW